MLDLSRHAGVKLEEFVCVCVLQACTGTWEDIRAPLALSTFLFEASSLSEPSSSAHGFQMGC